MSHIGMFPCDRGAILGGAAVLPCAAGAKRWRPVATQGRVDIAGALLATLDLVGGVFAFIEAPVRGWTSGAGATGLIDQAAPARSPS